MANPAIAAVVNVGFKLIQEEEYQRLIEAGEIDPNVYYFVYNDAME